MPFLIASIFTRGPRAGVEVIWTSSKCVPSSERPLPGNFGADADRLLLAGSSISASDGDRLLAVGEKTAAGRAAAVESAVMPGLAKLHLSLLRHL